MSAEIYPGYDPWKDEVQSHRVHEPLPKTWHLRLLGVGLLMAPGLYVNFWLTLKIFGGLLGFLIYVGALVLCFAYDPQEQKTTEERERLYGPRRTDD